MQPLLEVEGLKKTYPGFQLNTEIQILYHQCPYSNANLEEINKLIKDIKR